METPLSTFLANLRIARGLSLTRLAQQADLSPSTLSRWEAGAYLPRLPELEALLRALGASPQQRERALLLLQAPRSLQQLRRDSATGVREEMPLPSMGDLLRALRHRRGLSQEQVASRLGVRQSTLARWERSETRPPPDRLRELAVLLGAQPAEVEALSQNSLLLVAAQEVAGGRPGFDELVKQVNDLCAHRMNHPSDPLMILRYLALQSRLWPSARRSVTARYLYAVAATNYAWVLGMRGHHREAARQAEGVVLLFQRGLPPTFHQLEATTALARHAAAARAGWAREGIGLLRESLSVAEVLQTCVEEADPYRGHRGAARTYLWQTISHLESLQGDSDAAVTAARRAREEAAGLGFLNQERGCSMLLAHLLVGCDRAREALEILESAPEWRDCRQRGSQPSPSAAAGGTAVTAPPQESSMAPPGTLLSELLVWSEVLLSLGDCAAAAERLGRCAILLEAHPLPAFRRWADAIAERVEEKDRGTAVAALRAADPAIAMVSEQEVL